MILQDLSFYMLILYETSSISTQKDLLQLKEGVYFIPGVKRAAVCDTGTGNVYSINETAKRIILGEIKNPEFSEQLRQMNLMDGEPVPMQRENPNFQTELTVATLRAVTKLSAQRWRNLIGESYELGCRQAQFIGGEPFIWRGEEGETVLDLAAHARSIGYEFIEIFTNATQLTPAKVERIKQLDLKIAVSLYSDDSDIHDQITRTPQYL